jgi:hypothetical protein
MGGGIIGLPLIGAGPSLKANKTKSVAGRRSGKCSNRAHFEFWPTPNFALQRAASP